MHSPEIRLKTKTFTQIYQVLAFSNLCSWRDILQLQDEEAAFKCDDGCSGNDIQEPRVVPDFQVPSLLWPSVSHLNTERVYQGGPWAWEVQ